MQGKRTFFDVRKIMVLISIWALMLAGARPVHALELKDALNGLRLLAGVQASTVVQLDINGDDRFGLEEAAFILQVIAGLREAPGDSILVSGLVRDITNGDVAVSGATVDVMTDLNGDGSYSPSEAFTARSDDNGFFAVEMPDITAAIPRMTLHARCAGYSEFIKKYENVQTSFIVAVGLSQGAFEEIDISGIASSPARGGRVALEGDQVVSLRLVEDPITGRRGGRIAYDAPESSGDGADLFSVTFPLRGMRVPEGSEKIYANMAYLDTVNDPDTMPGDFISEGEGETPRDVLKTYAASTIKVYDENGNPLMTDPLDRNNQIQIKIAIPWLAYETLEDEIEATADRVEIPLYYYDEDAQIWTLHKTAAGSPAFGRLEDHFGNVLTREDLVRLQDVRLDPDTGAFLGTGYRPADADPTDVRIYTVGQVHHFSIYNSDKAGRMGSQNAGIKGSDGKSLDAPVRYKKVRGGYSSDYDKRTGSKRRNVHHYKPSDIDNAVKKLLSKDKAVRDQWLRWVLEHKDPALIEAIAHGVRRYAIEKREEWGDAQDDLSRGILAIFSNKMITDTIINSTDLDTGQIDCAKAPDICKGIVAQAAEQVQKSSDAKKATAFLMQIAVDAYNPGNLDFKYALDKGVGMIELAVNTGDAKGRLGKIPSLLLEAKQIRDNIKTILDNNGGWAPTGEGWGDYFDQCYALKQKVEAMKQEAGRLGASLKRRAAEARVEPSRDDAGLEWIQQETLWDYEDLGGVLYGANRFGRFKWGYYNNDGTFVETDPPAGLIGGGEVGVFEYFNGTDWVPLPGRSSTGIDAAFVPVPNVVSWGDGSPSQPVAYLGEWTIDVSPNVAVTGRLIDDVTGAPFTNAADVSIHVGNTVFHPDAQGNIEGEIALFEDAVYVTIPGAYYQRHSVAGGALYLGDIAIPDMIVFTALGDQSYTVTRDEGVSIDASAHTLSGDPIAYRFELYQGYYRYSTPILETENATGLLTVPQFDNVGRYYIRVEATAGDLSAERIVSVQVVNQNPVISAINVSPETGLTVGDDFTVSIDATDPDGAEDIVARWVNVQCQGADGNSIWMSAVQGEEAPGQMNWTVSTDNNRLYRMLNDDIACVLRASVRDSARGAVDMEKTISLASKSLAPVARYNSVRESYTTSNPLNLSPGWVRFSDQNEDIVAYELDCGLGGGVIRSTEPIYDADPDSEGNQACVYDPEVVAGTGPFTFTYKAIDSENQEAVITASVTLLQPVDIGVTLPSELKVIPPSDPSNDTDLDIVELPPAGDRSFNLSISATTPNADGGFKNFNYAVRYQPGYSYWWSTLAEGGVDTTAGAGGINIAIDKPGKYYVFADVVDNAGMYATFSKVFYVTADFDFRFTLGDGYAEDAADYYLTTDSLTFAAELTEGMTGFTGGYKWDILYDGDSAFTDAGITDQLATTFPVGTHTVRLTLTNTADANAEPVVKTTQVTVYDPLGGTVTADYTYPAADRVVGLGDDYRLEVTPAGGTAIANASWRVMKSDLTSAEGLYSVIASNGLLDRTFRFKEIGAYQVWIWIEDALGRFTTVQSGQFQVAAYPPVIDSLTADKVQGSPPLTVTLSAAASDTHGQVVNYIWKVSGKTLPIDGVIRYVDETVIQNATNTTNPAAFSRTFDQEGEYEISLVVEDDSGLKSEAQAKTIVVAYQPPAIQSLSADPASGEIPLETTLTAVASDSDGTIVAYDWDVSADGSVEQSGASATFTHRFETAAAWPVKLTVTDSQGKTATRTLTVYAFEPGSGVAFNFKEVRANGLGPDFDFAATSGDPHGEEMYGKFAMTGYDDINFDPAGVLDLTSPLQGMLGFDGFYNSSWGNPQAYLAKINTPGAYDIGLSSYMGGDSRTLTFPPEYVCGTLIYSGGASRIGTYPALTTPGQCDITPDLAFMTTGGVINVMALLGTQVVDNACPASYYGFVSGAGPTLALDASTQVPAVPVMVPANYALNDVGFSINGTSPSVGLWSLGDLPKDQNGNVLIPIAAGADYRLTFTKSGATYIVNMPAADLAGKTAIEPDMGIFGETAITLQNIEAGNLAIRFSGVGESVSSTANLTGAETSLPAVPSLTGYTTFEVTFRNSANKLVAYQKMAASEFSGTLDLQALAADIPVSNLTVAADTTAKTLNIAYTSDAPMCLVHVKASFAEYRSWERYFITDPAKTAFSISYPIPEIPDPYSPDQPSPATDAIQSANVTVSCMNPIAGYDDTLRKVFETLNYTNWYLNNFMDSEKIDALRSAEAQWRSTP